MYIECIQERVRTPEEALSLSIVVLDSASLTFNLIESRHFEKKFVGQVARKVTATLCKIHK
jgi:hypothetical protein